jgi:4-amino-4-deoxy-L-arabinose transferase-like glycosyltransferase
MMPINGTVSIDLEDASVSTPKQNLKSSPIERVLPLLIFAICFAYLCIFLRYSTLEPDEGIVLQGAERILAGQVPYRDFFSFYTPGSFYLVALLFRAFGDSFVVARTSLAVVGAICSVITYLLARRVCSRGVSIVGALLVTTAGAAFRFLVLHNPYSTLGSCLCLYAALRFVETKKSLWAFAMGSLASGTFLLEQSKGAGLYLGLGLGFAILGFLDREFRMRKRSLAMVVIGLLWPLIATFAYFGAHHAAGLMMQSWLWPLRHYTQANHVAYGFQNWSDHSREIIFNSGPMWLRVVKVVAVSPGLLVPVLPLIAIGVLVYWIIRMKRCPGDSTHGGYYLLVCSVLSGLLVSVVMVRADILHFLYLAPLWYLVLAWTLQTRGVRNGTLSALRVLLIALVGISFGLMSMAVVFAATGADTPVETRKGVIRTRGRENVIDYLQPHVAAGEQLLVYPYLPLYNYLTETRSPARYDYFQPGMNTPQQGQEIITSLQSSRAPVLFEPWFAEKIANSWPGTSLRDIASDPVADYITRNYRTCRMINTYEGRRFHFMVRKDLPCS